MSETCRQLGRLGVTVIVTGRALEKAEATARELAMQGIEAVALELDVSDSGSIAQAVSTVESEYGRLDILVNNAAILTDIGKQPSEVDEPTLRQNLDTNFIGPYLLTAGFAHLLKAAPAAAF